MKKRYMHSIIPPIARLLIDATLDDCCWYYEIFSLEHQRSASIACTASDHNFEAKFSPALESTISFVLHSSSRRIHTCRKTKGMVAHSKAIHSISTGTPFGRPF